MNKIFLIILLLTFALSYSEGIEAKKMIFGENKGKEVLMENELEIKNFTMVADAINEVLKEQKKTNELLEKMIESMSSQSTTTQNVLTKLSEKEKQAVKIAAVDSTKTDKTIDTAALEQLHKETNRLLKKLIEEQKWLSAIIQSQQDEGARVRGGR